MLHIRVSLEPCDQCDRCTHPQLVGASQKERSLPVGVRLGRRWHAGKPAPTLHRQERVVLASP